VFFLYRREITNSGWDLAPNGFQGMTVAQVAQVRPELLQPNAASASALLARQARRLYIGNIPPGVSEGEIAEFFNTAMETAKIATSSEGKPVFAVQINRDKAFGFIEFRSSEEASSAMRFDGITLQSYSLKVRRPKDFYEAEGGGRGFRNAADVPLALPAPGDIPSLDAENPNKLFVGGIPTYLNEDQIRELFSSFGDISDFQLLKDQAGAFKGFAFLEYLEAGVTEKALSRLNGMPLGEKTLVVQRAKDAVEAINAAGGGIAKPRGPIIVPIKLAVDPSAAQLLNTHIQTASLIANIQQTANPTPTRIICVGNVMDYPHEAREGYEHDELEWIAADMWEECEKFGTVLGVVIPDVPPLSEQKQQELDRKNQAEDLTFAEREKRAEEERNRPKVFDRWPGMGRVRSTRSAHAFTR
jgi:splicing factor U2AF subunit